MAATVHGLNLTKVYDLGEERLNALDDVSLEVFSGEMVAVVGRTGSGKSTLLHVLGYLQKPDSGQVLIEGVDGARLNQEELGEVRARRVGFVFQAFNLLPNDTAVANVEVALADGELSARDSRRKASEVLEYVGLGNRLDNTPSQLSHRNRQYISVARALVNNPAVIFADEPTRGLDSSSREELMGLFQKLNDDGMTIVIATADTGLARYCRRMVRMAEGKCVDDSLVTRRRIIPAQRRSGTPVSGPVREEEEAVCPRCNHGNPIGTESCQHCKFPLQLSDEDEQSIKVRLNGSDSRWLAVESPTDEVEGPGRELIEELKAVPFFSELGAKSLERVIPFLEPQQFLNGSKIVGEGDEGDSFYIIRSGRVNVVVRGVVGKEVPIAELGPKEGFGEMALLTGQPRSASVVAATDLQLWRLSKEAFQGLLNENLSISLYFNRILSQRLQAFRERVYPSA